MSMMATLAEEDNPSVLQSQLIIERPVYDMNTFNKAFPQKSDVNYSICQELRNRVASSECSAKTVADKCISLVPMVTTLREYKFKRDLVADLVAGVTVGVMHLPMGLAFAILSHIPAVYGLYASFWPTLLYAFFGTGRHLSVGTMAVMSLLLAAVVDRAAGIARAKFGTHEALEDPYYIEVEANDTLNGNDTMAIYTAMVTQVTEAKVTAAIGVTFLIGLIQLLLSMLQLGRSASFMSMSFVSGFTAGAACHIVTSQLQALLGLKIPSHIGLFRMILTLYENFRHIHQTHVPSLVLSLIAIVSLVVMKIAINDNIKLKPYLKIPIPAELILVIVCTIISHFAKLHAMFGIKIVGEVPRGFPKPALPDLSGAKDYVVDAFIMAVVSFVISFAMASLFSRKHGYEVNTNQEMFAYGICHSVGACFYSFAGAAAPPRCMVLDSTGGRTQVAAIFSSIILLLIILVIGPLFFSLPRPVLAAIVVCALIPMFKQFRDPYDYWKVSRYDTATWVITWAAVVFLDLTIGLVIGIAFSIFTVTWQAFQSQGYALTNMTATEVYLPHEQRKFSSSHNGIAVFRFESSLHFASRERFKQQLVEKTVDPRAILKKKAKELETKSEESNGSKDVESPFIDNINVNNANVKPESVSDTIDCNMKENIPCNTQETHTIIIDCSSITYIDMSGLLALKMTCMEYKKAGIEIALASCSISVLETLKRANMENSCPIYPTIHDAVLAARHLSSNDTKVMLSQPGEIL